MRRVLQLLAPRWRLALAVAACVAILGATTALYAWVAGPLLRSLFDAAPGSSGLPSMAVFGAALLGTAIVHSAASYGQQVLLARLAQDTVHDLRLALFGHVLRLSPEALAGKRTGELAARITQEVGRVQQLLSLGVAGLVRNAVQTLSLGALAFSMDATLAAVGLIGVPVIGAIVVRQARRTRAAFREAWAAHSELTGNAAETVHLVPLVRTYEAEARAEAGFAARSHRARERSLRAAESRARVAPAMQLAAAGAVLASLGLAATRIDAGQLSPEAAVSLFAAMFLLYRPVQGLGMLVHSFVGGLAALDRMDEITALPAEPEDAADAMDLPPLRHGIDLDQVSFAYDDGRPVLEGLSLTIRAGESVALVGPSGEGKTTLLLLLVGLLEPTRGAVSIDGVPAHRVKRSAWRGQFAWVGQEPLLFDGSVLDNLTLSDVPDRARAERAARDAGAHEFIVRLPKGYDTHVDEAGANLSVGERQRLCLARALYRGAPVLVLDEPTASLDGAAEERVGATLERLMAADRTVLLASHRERTVRRVDRVVVLSGGRVVEDGRPSELERSGTTYSDLFAVRATP